MSRFSFYPVVSVLYLFLVNKNYVAYKAIECCNYSIALHTFSRKKQYLDTFLAIRTNSCLFSIFISPALCSWYVNKCAHNVLIQSINKTKHSVILLFRPPRVPWGPQGDGLMRMMIQIRTLLLSFFKKDIKRMMCSKKALVSTVPCRGVSSLYSTCPA